MTESLRKFKKLKTRTERRLYVLSLCTDPEDIRCMSYDKISDVSILITINRLNGIKNVFESGRNFRHGKD